MEPAKSMPLVVGVGVGGGGGRASLWGLRVARRGLGRLPDLSEIVGEPTLYPAYSAIFFYPLESI